MTGALATWSFIARRGSTPCVLVSLESLEHGSWVDGEAITSFQLLLQSQPVCNLAILTRTGRTSGCGAYSRLSRRFLATPACRIWS